MTAKTERPAKRAKLLSEDESSDSDNETSGGVSTSNQEFRVNEEYARRFEYNKKREEKDRLEEKYKHEGNIEDDSDDDSTSEEEDDAGDLVTGALDNEISATLAALRSKDPRIYDKSTTFYKPMEETTTVAEKKEKPLYLRDYQRENLLNGANGANGDEDVPMTYSEEQDALKRDIVKQMHAAGKDGDEDEDGNAFMQKKTVSAHDGIKVHPSRKKAFKEIDIENAEKDPETFLSNFMSSRAWVPEEGSRFAHLDSDDSEDERRAEEFEEAYNMRFEDPETANAKLMSYARDTAKFSARREEKSSRQKQRDREREIKDAAKKERQEERARLKKLRIEEVERKVKKIKEAAGLSSADVLNLEEWGNVLDDDFDDSKWESEMKRRFGDKYYAQEDTMSISGDEADGSQSIKKPKKPTWDDDIDIKDLLPDFEDEEAQPNITLSDDEVPDQNEDKEKLSTSQAKPKSRKQQQVERKHAARLQHQAIESLVDQQLTTTAQSSSQSGGFRYRETSPVNFGLSARDILFADDAALNAFAGLKKTHAFRDEAKKAKDKKKLGKKARLREWRRDTFGNDEGYQGEFADYVRSKTEVEEPWERGKKRERDGKEKKHKKKTKSAAS